MFIGILWIVIFVVGAGWYFSSSIRLYLNEQQAEAGSPTQEVTTVVDMPLSISSSAFLDGEEIPARFTCTESQTSVPLSIQHIPEGAQSLAIIMEDRDIPERFGTNGTFLHWVAYDIPTTSVEIGEGIAVGTQGTNGLKSSGYMGPCPPRTFEPTEHRYYFTVYALDTVLHAPAGYDKDQLQSAMEGHVLEQAEMMGRYEQPEK